MESNFGLGVQVTILGMALVFLTLIIIMFAIMLLDRVFRPKRALRAAAVAPQGEAIPSPRAVVAEPDYSDEAAAMAVAIALRRQVRPATGLFPWDRVRVMPTEHPVGELVTVVHIDGGAGVWAGYGRLTGAR